MAAVQAFCAKLPKETLLPLEVELRASLLKTASLAAELLPAGGAVSLQDWVDYRMSDEVVFKANARGRVVLVSLVGCDIEPGLGQNTTLGRREEPKTVSAGLPHSAPQIIPPPPRIVLPCRPSLASRPLAPPSIKRARGTLTPEDFLNTLPGSSFSAGEVQLRDAILDFLYQKPQTLLDCSKDWLVQKVQADFLPAECPLVDWIIHRIGGEVSVEEDATGQLLLCPTALADPEQEAFFESLPPDHLTENEQQLHLAIADFIQNWSGAHPPTLSDLGCDPSCRDARNALFPDSSRATKRKREGGRWSLRSWLDRRLGDMFETVEFGRVVVIGFKGEVDKEAAASLVNEQKAQKAGGCSGVSNRKSRRQLFWSQRQ